MKNLFTCLSKKSLSNGNGSGMDREWIGNGLAISHKLLTSIIFLLFLGVGNVWGTVDATYTLSTSDNNKSNISVGSTTWAVGASAIDASSSNCKITGTISVTLPTGAVLKSVTLTKSNNWGSDAKVIFKAGSTSLNEFTAEGTFTLTSNKTNGSYSFTKGGTATKNAWVKSIKVTYYPQTAITLNANGGAANKTAKYNYNSGTKAAFEACTKDGYTCTGYWTASSGGTKILNTDGTLADASITVSSVPYTDSNTKWAYDGATLTLYAQWEAAASCTTSPSVSVGSLKGSVSSSSSATAQCTGGITNIGGAGCSLTSYGFAVGTSSNPTIGGTLTGTGKTYEVGSSIAASTGFEKLIDGLSASTTYYVRPYATNGYDTGYGTQFSFTTLAACTAAPTVTAGSKGTITSTTAAVTCASGLSSLGTGGCAISSYGFVYGTSANPTTSNSTTEVGTSIAASTSFNTTLTGLTEGTLYYVRPYATNGYGTGYGTQVSFGTPKITVSQSSRAFGDRAVGGSYEMTFTVEGVYLQSNISIAKSGTNQAMFSIDNATVTQTDGTAPTTTITVTYSPSTAGSHSATLTLSSTNATNKTVSLSGTGKWTVTFLNGNGGTHSTSLVANSTAPSKPGSNPAACDATSTTFIGWTQSAWSGKQNQSFIDGRTAANVKVYTSSDNLPAMTSDMTYYPVYAKGTETSTPVANTWTRITSTSQLTDGATVLLVQYYSDYAINTTPGATSCTAYAEITNSTANLRWTAVQSSSKWKFKSSSNHYLSTADLTNGTAISLDGTYDEWTISADAGGYSNCFNLNNGNDLEYYSSVFKVYAWSAKYESAYPFYIYIQKTTTTTTYSDYLTTCCTELGTIGGVVTFNSPIEAKVTWNKISNVSSWTLKYKVHGAGAWSTAYTSKTSSDSEITESGDNLYSTIDVSCNTAYDFLIIANPASGYCDKEEELTNKNSGKWDLDYTFSGAALKDGDLDEGTGVLCGDLDITIEPLLVAYELPSDVTVTIGGNSKTKGTDYTWDSSTGELHIDEAYIDGAVAVSCTASLVGCLADPSLGAVSLKTGGTFNLGQVDVTVATSGTGSATCAWTDYGFVWSESANPTVGGSGCTKVAVGSDGSATTWNGSLTKTSFATGTTYYYRAYGKNSKTSAAFAYSSSDGTFKPQSVTFNKANGEDNVVTYVNYNTAVSEPSDPSKSGYDFVEWQLSSSTYNFSDPVTNNITLTATWNAKSYTVTLKPNTGTGSDQTVSATFDADMPLKTTADGTPAISVPTKTGYTLLGYWDATSDGNQYYSYNAGTSTLSSFRKWNKTAATNLYAHWQANNYTITLDNEGADSGKEGTESISVTYDAYTNLNGTPAITKPVKDGYLFGGYFVGDDGTGTQIIDGDGNVIASVASYTSGTKQWIYADNITLHAKWTQVYTVTWSVNGETWSSGVVEGNTHVPGGSQVSALPTAPTSSDCDDAKVFVGWRATAIDGTSASNPGSIFTTQAGSPTISANTTFYAVFADVSARQTISLSFPDDNSANNGLTSNYYTSEWTAKAGTFSFTISNFNNNNWGGSWTNIRCGRNAIASTAYITTDAAISFRVDSVYVTVDAITATGVNAFKVQVANASTFATPAEVDITQSAAVQKIKIASPATGKYYRIVADCNNSVKSNGYVRISNVTFMQQADTANYVTSCSSCDDDATYTNTTPTVSDIDCTTATLTMEDGLATVGADGCHVSDYGFVIGTSDNPAIGGSGVEKLQVGTSDPTVGEDFSFDATGLTKGTHYYIRAYAINKHGTAYSTSTNFWTKNVSSIAITTASTKTNYLVGETFDATGMVVTATMADSNTEDVTSDVTYSSSALTAGANQDFAIYYSLCETAKSVNQKINVYTLTVTEGTNPSYGTAAGSVNIVSITGLGEHKTYTVTVTSDNATAVDNGDNTWSIINPTGNVTVTVDYADAVQVKVYYKVDGVTVTGLTQDVYQSETTTLPTASDLATAMTAQGMDLPDDDYPNFVGWSETEFSSQTSEPTIVSGTPAINAEKTYYAVFTNLGQIHLSADNLVGTYPSTEKTVNVGSKDFKYHYLGDANISGTHVMQFKKHASEYGYIYNNNALSNILRIEIGYYNSDSHVPVYAASAAGTIAGDALTPASRETTDPYVYTFPASTSYFMVKGDNSYTYKIRSIDIYYASSTVYYMTQFCTRYTITGASTSGTAVTGGTLTSSANSTCEGKSMTLSAAVNAGYAFGGWKIVKTGVVPEADVTSTLLPGDNASSLTPAAFSMPAYGITVSATITEKEVTGWTWKQELADASEITIPATVELYIGQQAKFNLKTYDPADVLAGKKGYSADYIGADLAQDNKAGAYYVTRAKIAKESTTLTLTSTSNGSVQEVITIRIKELPLVHFVDNIHGETFADVVAHVDASEKRTVYTTKPTPTHSDVSDPGASYNTCERQHLHLIGWIESEWADAHPNAEPGDITGAGAGNYYAAGADIDLAAQDGKTFYAVWCIVE